MITIENVLTLSGSRINYTIETTEDMTIDGSELLLMPGLIDSHVHFRTPGHEYKENWETGAKAALAGGYTTVFDMPNTSPSTTTKEALLEKQALIDQQLKNVDIPLRYKLYLGADRKHFDEIERTKNDIAALKVFISSSTGNLLVDDDSSLHAVFALAKAHDILVCTHAEDNDLINENTEKFKDRTDFLAHSEIRSPLAAGLGVKKAIKLARIYKTRLHILHVSCKEELDLIRDAKKEGLSVTCETTPHHLFLNTSAYETLGSKAQVNPALRDESHNQAVWEAIYDGTIDTIASDHAPHTLEEKQGTYPNTCSGMPGIETTLPLLLNAYHQGLISLEKIVSLTCSKMQEIFQIPPNEDVILVNLEKEKTVKNETLQTKCKWSAFEGQTLKGWPIYAILRGRLYMCDNIG